MGNTRQFSLSVPGGAGSSCVCECVCEVVRGECVSACLGWCMCACVRVCARGHRSVGGSARARCGCQPACPCVRALVCAPKCARAGDGGRVPPPPQPRPPLSNPRRKSRLPPPLHPAHPLLPHFLLLSLLLRAHSRTPRSSRWPPWESLAATAQLAPAVPPTLGHLLEAERQVQGAGPPGAGA